MFGMNMAFVERLLPRRAQPLVAVVVAACLVGMMIWFLASGGLDGGLVDHDFPPTMPLRFTVDINAASTGELAQLPGVGPALARRIADHRANRGPFHAAEQLLDVPGIGEATLDRLRPHLRQLSPPPIPATAAGDAP